MQIDAFCLCKAAPVNARNEPSLLEIFDSKFAAGEPVLTEPFVAAALIRFYKTETGVHRFQFVVKEESGNVLVSSTEIVSITELATESATYFLQCYMAQTGLKFGRYDFSIESGGKQLASTPLYVIRDSSAPAPRF
jgi:hypothetical protein